MFSWSQLDFSACFNLCSLFNMQANLAKRNSNRRLQRIQNVQEGKRHQKKEKSSCFCLYSFCFWGEVSDNWILNDIGRNFLLRNRKKIAKCLMRTFTCRSTFLYEIIRRPLSFSFHAHVYNFINCILYFCYWIWKTVHTIKGTATCNLRWFFAHPVLSRKRPKTIKILFGFSRKFAEVRLRVMNEVRWHLCRSELSPYRAKCSWCMLQIRLFSLRMLSMYDKIVLAYLEIVSSKRNSPKILIFSGLVYSRCAIYFLAYFPILCNYFLRFLRIRRNKCSHSTLPDYYLKGTVFQRNRMMFYSLA